MKPWWLRSFRFVQVTPLMTLVALSVAPGSGRADAGVNIYQYQASGVLLIHAVGKQENGLIVSNGTGTGFIVSPDGHVLTASHVIPDNPEIKELYVTGTIGPKTADHKPFRLELIQRGKYDAALLRIVSPPANLLPLAIRQKEAVGGEQIFVLGYPLGLTNVHFLDGSVSSVDGVDIATNVLVNKGNSGGPVFDQAGCVIGMVYSGIDSFDGKQITGIKFALRVAAFNDLIPKKIGNVAQPIAGKVTDKAIRVSDTLSRIQTDRGLADTIRSYNDRINARPGYVIKEIVAVEKTSLNPPQLPFPIPQISPDGRYIELNYNLISGPFYNQWRGWIDMKIHTLQMPEGNIASAPRPQASCQ